MPEVRQRQLAFKVGKRGDSVAAVAQRYRVSREQVAQWNKVTEQARFKPGQTVTVMVAARAAAPQAKAAQTRGVAARKVVATKTVTARPGPAPRRAAASSTRTAKPAAKPGNKLRVAQR